MRAIELTAKTFPLSIPITSFITCVLCSVPPIFLKPKAHFGFVLAPRCENAKPWRPKNTFRITMQNPADARVLNSQRCADRPSSVDLFDNFTALGFQHRGHGDRSGVAAAPAQRGDFFGHRIHALKAR